MSPCVAQVRSSKQRGGANSDAALATMPSWQAVQIREMSLPLDTFKVPLPSNGPVLRHAKECDRSRAPLTTSGPTSIRAMKKIGLCPILATLALSNQQDYESDLCSRAAFVCPSGVASVLYSSLFRAAERCWLI